MSDSVRTSSLAARFRLGLFRRSADTDKTVAIGPRGRLFRKYVLLIVGLVSLVLLLNSALDFWFSYEENKAALFRIQQEKATSAARRIEQFVDEIERQLGWTTAPQWAASPLEQRRFDYVRLLRQAPAITELIQLDDSGKEQLKVSRLAMDVVGSEKDYSQSSSFIEAKKNRVWFSPVYFRKESEPYMTVALARAGRNAGVTVAEVNLKLIWDVITGLKIGQGGYAYVVDRDGRLIAHPDISLVLRNTDLSQLPQVAAARAEASGESAAPPGAMVAKGINGNSVLTAHAAIAPLGWTVFVELPLSEALASLYGLDVAYRRIARPRACPGDTSGTAPRPPHDRADPGIAGWRRADRSRRTRPAYRHPYRRRTRRSRRRFQPHGRGPPEVLRRPRKKGRGPHRRTEGGARPADRDIRGAGGHQQLARRPRTGLRQRCWRKLRGCARPHAGTFWIAMANSGMRRRYAACQISS